MLSFKHRGPCFLASQVKVNSSLFLKAPQQTLSDVVKYAVTATALL